MSRECALANVGLASGGRWGHTEYSLEYHREYLAARTGVALDAEELSRAGHDRFGFDLLWCTNDGLVDWARTGRVTDMGHASYAADGSDQHAPTESPFGDPEEVWAFDAVAEYGLPDFEEQVAEYDRVVERNREWWTGQLLTGGCYRTIVSGAIAAFGWDMLLLAAAEPERMERVWDSFFRRTLFLMKAWARTGVEVIIQHDDFVWTAGPFMHPDIYRHVIIPRYAELWKPLRAAGKKVLFCSDGNYEMFMEDILGAGADGLIFEPCNDFGRVAERFGRDACLVGSHVDCRDLTLGKWEKVRADIDRTMETLSRCCRGAIVAVGNHLPPNIAPEMLDRYFEHLLAALGRG